jgi:hypothetical protein
MRASQGSERGLKRGSSQLKCLPVVIRGCAFAVPSARAPYQVPPTFLQRPLLSIKRATSSSSRPLFEPKCSTLLYAYVLIGLRFGDQVECSASCIDLVVMFVFTLVRTELFALIKKVIVPRSAQ